MQQWESESFELSEAFSIIVFLFSFDSSNESIFYFITKLIWIVGEIKVLTHQEWGLISGELIKAKNQFLLAIALLSIPLWYNYLKEIEYVNDVTIKETNMIDIT